MDYIYETHLHTWEASACALMPGAEYIEYMKNKGYSGMIVTDHFYNGNSIIPRDMPWEQWIERYCRGYENAKKAAEGTDFAVLFGVEYNFQGDEYLLYGIDKEWLLARPEMLKYTRKQLYDEVTKAGGLMIHAHPYRERHYISAIHLSPETCDGIEVYNAANEPYQNALAREYGEKYGLSVIAGSDIHYRHDKAMGGVRLSRPLSDIQDFIHAYRQGELEPVSIRPDGKVMTLGQLPKECVPEQRQTLPVKFHRLMDKTEGGETT